MGKMMKDIEEVGRYIRFHYDMQGMYTESPYADGVPAEALITFGCIVAVVVLTIIGILTS
jgi:hypothetical protein